MAKLIYNLERQTKYNEKSERQNLKITKAD